MNLPTDGTACRMVPLVLAVILGGCAVSRVDPPAPLEPTAQYKEGGKPGSPDAGLWQPATPDRTQPSGAAAVPDAWWTLFGDAILNDLQQRLVINNESLKAAAARVESARATLAASRSAIWPSLSAGLAATRSDNPNSSSGSNSSSTRPTNSFALSSTAAWEIDLWGRLSQGVTAAQSSAQAAADDLMAARLSAQATLAQTYFSMRAAEAQQALLERSAQAYQRSLDLTQSRYRSGVAARSDVLQAQTLLKSTQVQVLEAAAQRSQLEHAIAVLLGVQPALLSVARTDQLPAAPRVPAMLPASLLQRRPDIAAARHRVVAAYAQIGVADAAFFPSLSLSASAGYRRDSLSNLVSAPNLFWSLGPSLTQAIFDGGQRRLAGAQARASADEATATYRQVVLSALQEVEDNLVLADQLQSQAQLEEEALQLAQRNVQITLDQYRAGTVSYLNVVTAQASALSSENTLLSVRNRQLAAVNLLLKNIAGRWEATR